jgi:hypothetical protein
MLDKLLPAVREGSLPPRDRLALQNDVFALVGTSLSKYIGTSSYFLTKMSPLITDMQVIHNPRNLYIYDHISALSVR